MEDSTLTAREKSRIIKEKRLDYVPDPRGLGFELYHSMLLNGNVVAQIDAESGHSDTYGTLLRRCLRAATNLLLMGITKDDIIFQCSGNHLNSCIPIICALFLGVKSVSIDPHLSLEETKSLLKQIRPRLAFVTCDAIEKMKEAIKHMGAPCKVVVFEPTEGYQDFNSFLEPINEIEGEFEPLPISSIDETAIICYSSRKDPLRGICLSHYTLMCQLVNTVMCWNLGYRFYHRNHRLERNNNVHFTVMSFSSFYFIFELLILISSTMTASTRIIGHNFEINNVWKFIDEHKVSVMSCTTYQAVQLYQTEKPEGVSGKCLRILLTTGTSLSKPVLFELRKLLPRCFITNAYLQEEVGGAVSMFNFTKPGDIRDQYEKPTSCGKLMPGITCKIVDPITRKILPMHQAGELCYQADFMINAFYKNDSSIIFDNRGWIKSNDIGFYDERLCIHVLDSYDDVFRYKCWHIVPSIIENVIKLHPAIKNAAVIGIPNTEEMDMGSQAMGFVSLKKGMTGRVTNKDIEEFANEILTNKQQLILGVAFVREIPLTLTGKPDRQEIKNSLLCEYEV